MVVERHGAQEVILCPILSKKFQGLEQKILTIFMFEGNIGQIPQPKHFV